MLISGSLRGQPHQEEFGDVSLDALQLKRYVKDSSAAALILFDKGNANVDANSTIGTVFKRHLRIKIFNNSALEEWANISFLAEKHEVSRLTAATYNVVNGRVEKSEVAEKDIYKNKFTKGVEKISLAFPNVKEGSVIELAYTLKYEGAYIPVWQFQYSIPVVRSEYVLNGPAKMTPLLRGSVPITSHISKHNNSYNQWLMTDVPAFKDEPLMPDKNAYISLMQFVYEPSWEHVYAFFLAHPDFGKIVREHKYLTNIVDKITAGVNDPDEKIKLISDFIKRTVKWNGSSDYFADSPQEIMDKKSGTSGDINLLLASMLSKAGLKVAPVLLSTRDHGFIQQEVPSRSQFNYVICQVMIGERELLLDATEDFLPFDMLPGRCFNHKGFVVSKEHYGWIGIEPVKRDKILITSAVKLTEGGALVGTTTSLKEGYAAFNARKNYKSVDMSENVKAVFGSKHVDVTHNGTQNLADVEKPLTDNYDLNMLDYATLSEGFMYLNPFVFLREESNPFVLDMRDYPIDFEMIVEKVSICQITLPPNYTVEEMPVSKTLTLPENAAKCTLSVTQNGNQLLAVSRLQINKTLFMQDEYPNLKEFYARIVSKMSEVVILKKKM
jgi:hypothetical protein